MDSESEKQPQPGKKMNNMMDRPFKILNFRRLSLDLRNIIEISTNYRELARMIRPHMISKIHNEVVLIRPENRG